MKILFINQPHHEVYTKVPTIAGVNQPMGLAYLAAYLRENDVEVDILDAEALKIPINEISKYIPKDIDIVGCGSVTPNLKNAIRVFEIVKKINPKIITILGGDHITALPVETMQEFPIIDFGVFGEGEITALELIKTLEKGKKDYSNIKGLVYRKGKQIKLNPRRPLIPDINILPMPAYDLLPMDKYCPPAHHAGFGGNIKLTPFAQFFSLRGCPYNCSFCASKVMWERKVRYRNVDKLMEEIDHLVKKYKIKCLEFNDENFIINKKRMHQILDELIKRDYNDLHFNCLTRVDSVDEESLRKMKKAGCYLIRFGVESGSQRILNAMQKDITVEQVRSAFKLVNKVGIPSTASFIIGYPGETKETFEETLKLAKEIKPVEAFFFIAIPIVGTKLYEIAKEKNLILNPDWNGWVQMAETPIIKTETLETSDLLNMRKRAYREFYFRPSYILKMISNIRTIEQFRFYVNGALGALNLAK